MSKKKHALVSDSVANQLIVLFCILSLVSPAAAYGFDGLEKEVGKIELAVLGSNRTNSSVLDRVDFLEKSISGESKTGPLQERIETLARLAGTAPKNVETVGAALPGDEFALGISPKSGKAELQKSIRSTPSLEEAASADEFSKDEIEAIKRQAQNAKLSPVAQAAIQTSHQQQQSQALKRKVTATTCVMAMQVGRSALRSSLRSAIRWRF